MKLSKNLSSISCKCVLLLTALAGISLSSCKDDGDDKKLSDDPRVRKVMIPEFSDYEFVVNDAEGIIFNYDSLPYGTRVDSLVPYFYGYSSTDLPVCIKNENSDILTLYMNNASLDLSRPLSVVSTSEDGRHNKTYTFDLRVHKYDVDAFDWDEIATLDLDGDTIYSEKSILYGNIFSWFVRTNHGSLVFKSTNGKDWTKKAVTSPSDLDFENLVLCGDTLFATTVDNVVVKSPASGETFETASLGSASVVDRILFTIDSKVWFISGNNICSYSSKKEGVSKEMPEDFRKSIASGEFKAFSAASGYTTLGYVYCSTDSKADVWSIDRYGNIVCLSKGVLPIRKSPIVFNYGETLGLIGGYDADNILNNKCYSSKNSGLSWSEDWHKDFSESVGAIAKSGVFVTSEKGELLLVGGLQNDGVSAKVYAGRLRILKQKEEFLNSLK